MRLYQKIHLVFGAMLMVLPSLAQENNTYENITIQEGNLRGSYILDEYVTESNKNIPIVNNAISTTRTESIQTSDTPPDFKIDGNIPLSKRLFIYLDRDKSTYQGISSYVSIHGALGWRINDHISVTGGLLAIKQFSGIRPSASGRSGVKFNLNYRVNESANFNLWGQYLTTDNSNKPKFADLLMPQTSSGVSTTLKIGKNSQIGVAIQYNEANQSVKGNYESKGKFQLNF